MTVSLPVHDSQAYAIPPRALRRWASERVRREDRPDGRVVYTFALSGSTCANRPIDVLMIVTLDRRGRIESATAQPAPGDSGCDAMCAAADSDGARFLADMARCDDAVGLTLEKAAFRDWQAEASGCFCTPANRRHKWRNVFQTLHYVATSGE